jgi:O-antigen/teichoic acid export membrane protein
MGSSTRAALALTAGRSVGFVVAFAIPLVLVRVLSQHDFGTYKYLFMVAATLGCLELGMAESLYYFMPRARDQAARYVANALGALVVIGLAVAAVGGPIGAAIAHATGNGDLAGYVPLLAVFLALTLVAAPLEIVMITRQRHRAAAVSYALSDTVRALLLLVPGILWRDIGAILAGATIFAALRAVAVMTYAAKAFGSGLRPDWALCRTQLAYAMPFAVAVIIEMAQFNLHHYVVWARFDAATFAIYAAGCMQVPVVDLFALSVANILMVRMGGTAANPLVALDLWHATVRKLAWVLVPLVVALWLTARELIVTLFTPAYLASVPVFMVSVLTVLMAILPVDAVLRVYAQTRFLIVMNVVRLAVVAAGIGWALSRFDLLGAIGMTVVGLAVAKGIAVARIAGIFGVGFRRILPWRDLTGIGAAALVAAVPAYWLHEQLSWPPFLTAAATATLYVAVYLTLVMGFHTPRIRLAQLLRLGA